MSELIKPRVELGDTVTVPLWVGKCPYCGDTGLNAEISGVTEKPDGTFAVDEIQLSCTDEPEDIESQEYWEHMDTHTEMPYVYWLPLEAPVVAWLNENHRIGV